MNHKDYIKIFDFVLMATLAIAMILFYVGSVRAFNLIGNARVNLIIILGIIYLIILVLVLRFKGLFLEKITTKEKIVEKPVVKVVEKIVERPVEKRVYIDKTKKPEKKYKYYGSTLQNTYHKESCRFSGMIKPEHLILRNTTTYFKKNKFRPCKNCHPERK